MKYTMTNDPGVSMLQNGPKMVKWTICISKITVANFKWEN